MLSRLLSPGAALVVILAACSLIEGAQHAGLYEAHNAPLGILAHVSGVVPCNAVDRWCSM